jgi:hypothetical protein
VVYRVGRRHRGDQVPRRRRGPGDRLVMASHAALAWRPTPAKAASRQPGWTTRPLMPWTPPPPTHAPALRTELRHLQGRPPGRGWGVRGSGLASRCGGAPQRGGAWAAGVPCRGGAARRPLRGRVESCFGGQTVTKPWQPRGPRKALPRGAALPGASVAAAAPARAAAACSRRGDGGGLLPHLAGYRAHRHKLLGRGGVDAHGAVELLLGDAHLDGDGKALGGGGGNWGRGWG